MNKYVITGILFVVLLWLGCFVFSLGVLRIPDFKQNSLNATVRVHGGQRIKQEFISVHPNFSSLGISLLNRQLQNKKDLELIIWEDKTKLRTVVVNGAYIQDGKFVRFDFEPIPDSAGKKYTLDFGSPTSVETEALEIFLTKEDNSQAGLLLVSELPYPEYRSVAFVSFHKPDSRLTAFGMVVNDFIRRLTGDPFFIILFAVLVGGLLTVGFIKKSDRFFPKV